MPDNRGACGEVAAAGARAARGPLPEEDELYAQLIQGIIAKRIRPGSRVREAAVAAEFGVSRGRVRRVLLRLAELGMVQFQLNLGATVVRPTPTDARDAFELRRVLEREVVERVVERGHGDNLIAMRAIVEGERAAHARGDVGLMSISSSLHLALAAETGNKLLARTVTHLVNRCVLMQALYERPSQSTVCLVDEHEAILDHVIARDAAAAIRMMEIHLDHLEESLDYSGAGADDRLSAAIG